MNGSQSSERSDNLEMMGYSPYLEKPEVKEVFDGFRFSDEALPHGVEADIEQLLEVRRTLAEPKLKPDFLASLERKRASLNERILSSLGEGGEEVLRLILKEQEEFGEQKKKLRT